MILATKGAVAHSGGTPTLPYTWIIAGIDGSNSKLATSTDDGSTWTVRTTPFGSNIIRCVASNGSNLWVAGAENGVLATSPDGVTWTAQTSSFGSSDITEVIWANGLWVACGQGGKIATSTNGTTWTQQTSGTTQLLQGADYGAGTYGVGGYNGFVTSTDGTTWTSRSTSTFIKRKGVHYFAAQSIWVVGSDSTSASNSYGSSPDAITWTQRNSTITNSGVWSSFASKATILVNNLGTGGIGIDFYTQTSTNGTTYTSRGSTGSIDVACSDTGVFLATTLGSNLKKSTNGTSWTTITPSGLGSITSYCIAHSSMKPGSRP